MKKWCIHKIEPKTVRTAHSTARTFLSQTDLGTHACFTCLRPFGIHSFRAPCTAQQPPPSLPDPAAPYRNCILRRNRDSAPRRHAVTQHRDSTPQANQGLYATTLHHDSIQTHIGLCCLDTQEFPFTCYPFLALRHLQCPGRPREQTYAGQ